MTGSDGGLVCQRSAHVAVLLRDSGVSAEIERIRATARRLDDTTLAAAESHRSAEKRLHEGTLTQSEASAIFDAASADAPHAFSLLVLLGALGHLPSSAEAARPELVTESAFGRILDALRGIDSELNNYISDRDAVHLANVLDTRTQNLHQVLRRCFGYWMLPKDPARAGKIKRLGLRLGTPDSRGHPDADPALKLLADDVEGLAEVRGRRYRGFPPAQLLGPGSPLLPAEPARHVPLYAETSGGTGCIAALIHTWGDYIVWNDLRQFENACAPTAQPDPYDGSPFGMPQVFDGEQYRGEVRRASEEWAQEAPAEATAEGHALTCRKSLASTHERREGK